MELLSKESIAEAEVILNRTNIALARSRKLIQSWMSSAPATEEQASPNNDEDFAAESETTGLGSTVHREESDTNLTASLRRHRATNEKLLEQILGKKRAREHLKAKQSRKEPETPKALNGKTQSAQKNSEVSDDDEDESRTAAIGKPYRRPKQPTSKPLTKIVKHATGSDESDDGLQTANRSSKPAKRKSTSYLDELLERNAKKRKKGR